MIIYPVSLIVTDCVIGIVSNSTTELDTYSPPVTFKSPSIDDVVFTLNPYAGSVEAVTLPLAINDNSSTFSARAERGISNKSLPLPLNEPLIEGDSILLLTNIDPVTITVS